jgi:hypothetical protein
VGSQRAKRAWLQAYRSVDHGLAKRRCRDKDVMPDFPQAIRDFANMFASMQEKRHRADYDPTGRYFRSSVKADIDAARVAISAFQSVDKYHRRAFAVFVTMNMR